ncbi:hypothetical protein CSQ96_10235 [Janthinobacterium sp. BJB412]|nr:hypothetical protein CSQ96_10235 [Janthinobacterium sp. BJB412]
MVVSVPTVKVGVLRAVAPCSAAGGAAIAAGSVASMKMKDDAIVMFFIKIPGVIDTKKLVCVAVRLGAMPCPARRCPLFFSE